jgi:hypothetical protein
MALGVGAAVMMTTYEDIAAMVGNERAKQAVAEEGAEGKAECILIAIFNRCVHQAKKTHCASCVSLLKI